MVSVSPDQSDSGLFKHRKSDRSIRCDFEHRLEVERQRSLTEGFIALDRELLVMRDVAFFELNLDASKATFSTDLRCLNLSFKVASVSVQALDTTKRLGVKYGDPPL